MNKMIGKRWKNEYEKQKEKQQSNRETWAMLLAGADVKR